MKISSFFDELRAKNIKIYLKDGKVKVDAEKRFLTDDFLQELRSRKNEIAEYLTELEKENSETYPELHSEIVNLINQQCKEWDAEGRRNANNFTWTNASLF